MRDADHEWLTPREVAMRLRRSYSQVLRLMECGTLTSRRTASGRYLVLKDDVDQLDRCTRDMANKAVQ